MGKYVILVVGVLFIGLGLLGTYNAVSSWGEVPEPRSDISARGIVTEVTVTELKHAIGVTLDSTFEMKFEFQAEDGQTYSGKEMLTEAQAKSLREGQQVAVKYHSDQPSINAAVDYGSYYSVDQFKRPSSQARLIFCLGFTCLGGLITLYALKFAGEPESGGYALSA